MQSPPLQHQEFQSYKRETTAKNKHNKERRSQKDDYCPYSAVYIVLYMEVRI